MHATPIDGICVDGEKVHAVADELHLAALDLIRDATGTAPLPFELADALRGLLAGAEPVSPGRVWRARPIHLGGRVRTPTVRTVAGRRIAFLT